MDSLQVALSDLVKGAEEFSNEDNNAYITPNEKDGFVKCISHVKRKDIILEFLDILCYPGALIKKIDISINVSNVYNAENYYKICRVNLLLSE